MAARPAEIDYVPVPLPIFRRSQPSRRQQRAQTRRGQLLGSAATAAAPVSAVEPLAPQAQFPATVRNLMLLQRGSSVLMLGLGAMSLMVYSWTVHSQRAWSEAYGKLDQLRRNEPQLTVANEALKQHLANDAELENSGLVDPDPTQALFLEPASPRPPRQLPVPEPKQTRLSLEFPLSY